MGIFSSPLPDSIDVKCIVQGSDEEKSKLSESLWNKVLEAQDDQAKRIRSTWQLRKRRFAWENGHVIKGKKPRRVLMKKRTGLLEGSRSSIIRPSNMIERKVNTLKKLIPNSDESLGLVGLFRETADYILALQMRVKVMQTVVNVLTDSDE